MKLMKDLRLQTWPYGAFYSEALDWGKKVGYKEDMVLDRIPCGSNHERLNGFIHTYVCWLVEAV